MSKIDMNLNNEMYKAIEVPPQLDDKIAKGIEMAKKHRRNKFLKPISGIAAVFFIFMFLVNASVVFAKAINTVPLIRNLGNLVLINPGIKYALEEGYIQTINKSAESHGIKIKVTRIIGDNKKLIFGYTIEGFKEEEGKYLGAGTINLEDEKGFSLKVLLTWGAGDYKHQGLKPLPNEKYFEIDIIEKDNIPKNINIIFKGIGNLNDPDRKEVFSDAVFKVPVELKDKILNVEPEIYKVNKIQELHELKLEVKEIRIYPMVTELVINNKVGKDNKFTWLDNAYLEDEKGNIFRLSSGSTSLGGDNYLLRFNGGAFNNLKELTLKTLGMYYQPYVDKFLILDNKAQKLINDGGYDIEYVSSNYKEGLAEFVFKPKSDSKITSISVNFGDTSKYHGGYAHYTGSEENQKIEEFGVRIDEGSANKDILKFVVSNIQKYKTESFSVKLK